MLSDVSILITAGWRPGYLDETLMGLIRYLPECKRVVVTDDNYKVYSTSQHPTTVYNVPDDTFLTRKRNLGVSVIDTKYTLLAADDFEWTMETRASVIQMVETLDAFEFADVIAGTVNNKRYEGFLEVKEGEYIRETRLDESCGHNGVIITPHRTWWHVDLATNFFIARTDTLRWVPWDETIGPIGGEHADWFLDMKEKNRRILWSPGLNINEQPRYLALEHCSYRQRRNRAWSTGHQLFLKKRGVKCYIGFDETV